MISRGVFKIVAYTVGVPALTLFRIINIALYQLFALFCYYKHMIFTVSATILSRWKQFLFQMTDNVFNHLCGVTGIPPP